MSQIFRSSASLELEKSQLALSTIYLFVDRFRRALQFCYLEFDKETICDFRELSFCGPCGTYFYKHIHDFDVLRHQQDPVRLVK